MTINGNGNGNGKGVSYNGKHNDIIGWFEDVTKDVGASQTQTLRKILELNHRTEYLKKWLGEVKIQDFDDSGLESLYKNSVPMAIHADFEPFIQRIADGDTSPLLTQYPVTALALSSGTTEGRAKHIPLTSHWAPNFLELNRLTACYIFRAYPTRKGGKILEFIYCNKLQKKTKGGLAVGPLTTHLFNSEEFKIKQEKTKSFTLSPHEVISSGDFKQSTYCHLLLGLFFAEEVESVAAIYAYSIAQAFSALEETWEDLCVDIKQGILNPRIDNPSLRKAVLCIIYPNPNLALKTEEVCKELKGLGWHGLVSKLWPNAKFVCSIMTGPMQPYVKRLRHYAKDVPLVNFEYAASEGFIGLSVDPESPPENASYAVVPTISYFEFIPLRRQTEIESISIGNVYVEEEPVSLSEVKLGQEYEMVLTTFNGLYRYRLGDIVKVVGFHNKTPKLSFVCRRKLLLSVTIDKTTERDLQIAVDKAAEVLTSRAKAELADYTSHAARPTDKPGHYIIYWEIEGLDGDKDMVVDDDILQECSDKLDTSFTDDCYKMIRRNNTLGPLELKIVAKGTFKSIFDYFVHNGGTIVQFKTPRCTDHKGVLGILDSRTVKTFRSKAFM